MMKKVNSNLSKSHANNIIKISYSEEENQKSIKCNGFNLIELPLNEDNISMKGLNNESNIIVEIKEPEKESLLNKEYQRLKDVSHKVQDYYLSNEENLIIREDYCHKCLMTDFESNELLHFNSRKELLNYLKYCFVFEKKILFTNHQIYINNKYDLEKCDGTYLNGWRFFIPKTICKSCFMKIINMDKLFANLKTVICDVSPKRNKINNNNSSSNSNQKNNNNNNNNEGKWSNNNKKNGNGNNVGGIKRIHAKKKYMRSKRIHGSARINNVNNNNDSNKMNNIKNNNKNNNKNLMKNHHFYKKNNNKNNINNNNKINENIINIDENNNIIIDKKIFNVPSLESIENNNNNNNIKNIEIENNNNNKYNSQILFSHNQLRINNNNNNNNNQNNYNSNNSIGNTTINNINIVNKFNNKIDGFSNNNNNNNIISITNNNNINNFNQNDLNINNQSILIPKIFSNKYYIFMYVKITEILNNIKDLKDNLKNFHKLYSNNFIYLHNNNNIKQFYCIFYKAIFDIYNKQNDLSNYFNDFLEKISILKSKIYNLYTQPMFQNYYQKICSMLEHLNKLENENKENFEFYQNIFNNFTNFSKQFLLLMKQEFEIYGN